MKRGRHRGPARKVPAKGKVSKPLKAGLKGPVKPRPPLKALATAALESLQAKVVAELRKREASEQRDREKIQRRIEKLTYADVSHGDVPSVRPRPATLIPGRSKKKKERKGGERFGIPYYKDAVHKLRRLGVAGFDAETLPLRGIKRDEDLSTQTARKIERAMSKYDHLFARPHIIKRYGTDKESKKRMLAAQQFGGHFDLDRKLRAAVIPVMNRDKKKVRVKHNKKTGEVSVVEEIYGQRTETFDIPLDRVALARNPTRYLDRLLQDQPDGDRFVIGAGTSVINQSLSKKHLLDRIGNLMKRYDDKSIVGGRLVYAQNNWRNWLLSIKRERIYTSYGTGRFSQLDLERGEAAKESRERRAELMAEQEREADVSRKRRARLTKRMRHKGRM